MASQTISLHVPYIKTLHKQPYPAISPLRQELSQTGRTVLVVGGSAGIGFAIAKAFVQASASHVIITGRRQTALADAVARLEAETSNGTAISCFVSDMSDLHATEKLWEGFKLAGTAIDVLVLNAMAVGEAKTILDAGIGAAWSAFETNVRGLLDCAERFYKQDGQHPKVGISLTLTYSGSRLTTTQFLVNISSSAIHNFSTESDLFPIYGLTKNSGTLLMQLIAKDTDPELMQVINMHPGGILSEAAKNAGYTDESMDWDDGKRCTPDSTSWVVC